MNKLLHSLVKNKVGIILMAAASLCTALGQLSWKLSDGMLDLVLWIGFFLYFSGALFMLIAFRFGDLSILHPLLSLGYVFAIFFGWFLLQEQVDSSRLIGTLIIITGAILIGGGDD
ncbi:hypothetical protein Pryu01_00859 [Paraliobacillus ryukyuensis]|uniref:Putative membrane protein n=1 Tax=Paraliobacillus ryukyuensis TaxID=200904 RepID=A0A366EE33_9BACI|nr:EamA family transporter [Paraliobacillus ryukyuensis]RBP00568.1 putative membrane protein [Paraliobacillus ryukyuensis]